MDANIEGLCECDLCFESYLDVTPKILTCGHTICEGCANLLFENSASLLCAICRAVTVIPPSGVSGLPTNYLAKSLAEQAKGKSKQQTTTSVQVMSPLITPLPSTTSQDEETPKGRRVGPQQTEKTEKGKQTREEKERLKEEREREKERRKEEQERLAEEKERQKQERERKKEERDRANQEKEREKQRVKEERERRKEQKEQRKGGKGVQDKQPKKKKGGSEDSLENTLILERDHEDNNNEDNEIENDEHHNPQDLGAIRV